MMAEAHYGLLGLDPSASDADLRRAYKKARKLKVPARHCKVRLRYFKRA